MDWISLSLSVAKALAVVSVLMGLCLYSVLAERKVSSWIQGRVGPNRTSLPLVSAIPFIGPFLTRLGLFQPFADGGKFLFKEEMIPSHVNKFYFVLAPILALIPALVTVTVIPFGRIVDASGAVVPMVLANLDIGILFIFAVSSLGVYGIILAGWASNSKYPFLGGVRASAQMISYELALSVSILPVFLWVNAPGMEGTLSLFAVVSAQNNLWFIIWQPVSALVFMTCLFAETNRLPFDMPESETDLVGGYHTEYSAFKFGLFFTAEYAHMIVGSAVFTLLFLGGWHPLPFVTLEDITGWVGFDLSTGALGATLSVLIMLGKIFLCLFFFMWIRWTVPRFRYDQVMRIGWTMMLPLALGNLVVYAIVIALLDRGGF